MTFKLSEKSRCCIKLVRSWSTTMIIASTMLFLNCFLISENKGNKKIGVTVLLVIADLSALTIIRCIACKSEEKTSSTLKRVHVIGEWTLYIFSLETKLFFILEHIKHHCLSEGCEHTQVSRKLITILQTVTTCALFVRLSRPNNLRSTSPSYSRLTFRSLFIVIDLVDVVDLESFLWESSSSTRVELSFLIALFIYCGVAMLLVPLRFFIQAPHIERKYRNRKFVNQPIISIVARNCSFFTVNVAGLTVRCFLALKYSAWLVSTGFVAKNILFCAVTIFYMMKKQILRCRQRKLKKEKLICLTHDPTLSNQPDSCGCAEDYEEGKVEPALQDPQEKPGRSEDKKQSNYCLVDKQFTHQVREDMHESSSKSSSQETLNNPDSCYFSWNLPDIVELRKMEQIEHLTKRSNSLEDLKIDSKIRPCPRATTMTLLKKSYTNEDITSKNTLTNYTSPNEDETFLKLLTNQSDDEIPSKFLEFNLQRNRFLDHYDSDMESTTI